MSCSNKTCSISHLAIKCIEHFEIDNVNNFEIPKLFWPLNAVGKHVEEQLDQIDNDSWRGPPPGELNVNEKMWSLYIWSFVDEKIAKSKNQLRDGLNLDANIRLKTYIQEM